MSILNKRRLFPWLKTRTLATCLIALCALPSCSYLKYAAVQANYTNIQNANPSQTNVKHMLNRETFFVIGKTLDHPGQYADVPLAVAAYSDKFTANERVDTMFCHGSDGHFGLNLPAGDFVLQVYADINGDAVFDNTEVVGERPITLTKDLYPALVTSQIDISLTAGEHVARSEKLLLPVGFEAKPSLYFPTGTIRNLNDPIFDQKMASLGMYDPASFLEHAPTMFYALEEDEIHKIPVVFVHGIDGSPRSFEPILSRLDRKRYRPWFFYYPSGGDLDQLADFFYKIFLSGDVIPLGDTPLIVVAHSMGGLVVREAINSYKDQEKENKLKLFITIASPLGGHPSARNVDEKPGLIVLPAWRDLNPESQFIKDLYRKPLPKFVDHRLFYAYKNSDNVKLGENSDGVVPLSSQLYASAQEQANQSYGFDRGHVDILMDEKMIAQLMGAISSVKNVFSEESMAVLIDGGIDVELNDTYHRTTEHVIHFAGKYLVLLSHGKIKNVLPEQKHFIQATQGHVPANTLLEEEFIRFMKQYPELVNEVLQAYP